MKACVLKDVSDRQLSLLDDFCPLYTTVSRGDLEACAKAVSGGTIPLHLQDRDWSWIRGVGTAALETEAVCEAFIQLDAEAQLAFPLDGLSDFSLAALSDILTQSMDGNHLEGQESMMNDLLLKVLDSKTASPLLDYEWIFEDMVQYHVVDRRGIDPVWTLKRSAAHHLKFGDGTRMPQILAHMASVHLELDAFSEAVRIYCELLRYDPTRVETLRTLAENLAHVHCFSAAEKVARHLLEVWQKNTGRIACPELTAEATLWGSLARKGGADTLSCHLTALLNDSLYATYAGHFDVERLARDVIPEIDTVPVKERLW